MKALHILYLCTAVCLWVTCQNSMLSVECSATYNVQKSQKMSAGYNTSSATILLLSLDVKFATLSIKILNILT